MDYIVDNVSQAAILGQCAEECVELAHTCMKLVRKMGDENPTPVPFDALMESLTEEMADVLVCLDVIFESGLASHEAVESYQIVKTERWERRIHELYGDEPDAEA